MTQMLNEGCAVMNHEDQRWVAANQTANGYAVPARAGAGLWPVWTTVLAQGRWPPLQCCASLASTPSVDFRCRETPNSPHANPEFLCEKLQGPGVRAPLRYGLALLDSFGVSLQLRGRGGGLRPRCADAAWGRLRFRPYCVWQYGSTRHACGSPVFRWRSISIILNG